MLGMKWNMAIWALVYSSLAFPQLPPPAYRIQSIAGSANAGDNLPAVQALLTQAEGLAFDNDGNLYIADAAEHRIRRLSPTGILTTVAGNGTLGYSGDNGPATDAQLASPYGLALDRSNNLYIADLGNRVIRRVTPQGRITTYAGGGANPATAPSEGSPATTIRFTTPRNVAADPDGTLYISDFDAHRIYAVSSDGTFRLHAGTGNPGYGANDITALRSSLRNPAGLWIDPQGGLLVAEAGAQRIRRIARGMIGAYAPAAAIRVPLYSPTGVAVDSLGNLFLADNRKDAALKRSSQGEVVTLPAGGSAVTVDNRGNAFYANGAVVHRISSSNQATIVAGASGNTLTGDNGPADAARLNGPAAVVYDANGNLFLADERSHRVRRISLDGSITTIAGTGVPGFSGDGGPANLAKLNGPRGLSFDRFGNLLIADTANHAIRRVAVNGVITTVAGNNFNGFRGDGSPAPSAMLDTPTAVLADPNSNEFFIADSKNHRVRRVSMTGIITTYAGTVNGAGFSGDGNVAVFAQLNFPTALAFDRTGQLYIADSGNNRIRRVDLTGTINSLADGSLSSPMGVAVSPDGAVFVADTANHRIRRIDPLGNAATVAGTGLPGFSGDGGPAADARLHFPSGLTFDSAGNLLIADAANHRLRRLVPNNDVVAPPAVETPQLRFVHVGTNQETQLAPGMLLTLYGVNLGPADPVIAPAINNRLSTRLGDVEVTVNGIAAPLLYVSNSQINLQVPNRTGTSGRAVIEVRHRGQLRATQTGTLSEAVPGFFPLGAVHADGSINSDLNPAPRGEALVLYATGIGRLTPEPVDGQLTIDAPFPTPVLPAQLTIGGAAAPILWIGAAPGFPGVIQINFRSPSGFFPAGRHAMQLRVGQATTEASTPFYLR
jgi:trimeric autotransporter adhesin